MKFLVDNQLPGALAVYLRQKGFDCEHVVDAGLGEESDVEICRYAIGQDRVIISKDEDFLYLAGKPDTQIRMIWVRLGNCRTSALLQAFEQVWPRLLAVPRTS